MRALLGWPLGSVDLLPACALMYNILGTGDGEGGRAAAQRTLAAACKTPGARIHWYDKECQAKRKMGHVNIVAPGRAAACRRLDAVAPGARSVLPRVQVLYVSRVGLMNEARVSGMAQQLQRCSWQGAGALHSCHALHLHSCTMGWSALDACAPIASATPERHTLCSHTARNHAMRSRTQCALRHQQRAAMTDKESAGQCRGGRAAGGGGGPGRPRRGGHRHGLRLRPAADGARGAGARPSCSWPAELLQSRLTLLLPDGDADACRVVVGERRGM